MKNRRSDSAGFKTFVVALGDIQHMITIRRLPMRPSDTNTRHRVRLVRSNVMTGEVLSNGHRDLDIFDAYRIFEQNVVRLAAMVA